ncbi:unnamed protein product (macronuclear) [Paramecium tetraurelia]|uniref:Glutaredoxin domain-containing protein n=1 Tax=Paramecium tetraurelia TaxID=5888 RepID=A0BG85_PARTE|nr:uncharacterized protein GSPATT00028587001 [Paramecium tetraurelia]CAK57552.1 unnamed protein product [Paramecium tetraurelia]|eukprot:XP_001424950.1 hypothetical protein (macronuclear) [Paramecium tetraurelia strain d4-2]
MIKRLSKQILKMPQLYLTTRMIAPFSQHNHNHSHDHDHNHNHDHSHPDFQPQQKAQPQFTQEQIQQKHKEIDNIIKSNQVVLFMKGTPAQPMCGYSNYAVQVLQFYKVQNYHSVDILSDPLMREEIKKYSNWPTFPQLYVKQELIGGCDIMMEMHKEGTLKELFNKI